MIARVSQLHKTEAAWQKLDNWKPEAGELIVYDPDEKTPYARLKVGDGQHTLAELAFLIDAAANAIFSANNSNNVIDCGRIAD